MSDKIIELSSFKYGLDSRREQLTSVPGTLSKINNAHINSGGEIEQRMSFNFQGAWPNNCFGLETTDQGLVTFGSDAAPSSALPPGVIYQQLVATNVGGVFEGALIAVPFSCNFEGKAFVLAKYAGLQTVLAFYDGQLVGPFWRGRVLWHVSLSTPEVPSDLASDLAGQINLLPGWTATPNVDKHGTAALGYVTLTSPPGVNLTPVTSTTSVEGQIGAVLADQSSVPVAAVGASVSFTITVAVAGNTIILIPPTSLIAMTDLIPFNTSINQTAKDLAANINLNTIWSGYFCIVSGPTITIYAPASFGNLTDNLTVATDMTVVAGAPVVGPSFTASVSPSNLKVVKNVRKDTPPTLVSGLMQVTYAGQTGAVTINWQETDANGNVLAAGQPTSGIAMSNVNAPSCGFSKTLGGNGLTESVQGYFIAVVHDAGTGTTVTVRFFVSLQALVFFFFHN